jgi:putative FmdB family regulatory protein
MSINADANFLRTGSVLTVPMYEYRCTKCNHVFEKIQKFSDPPITECPKCGALVEQVISAPAVQFKGAGWYVNDYAKKSGGGNGSKSDVSSSSETKSSESKGSESKSSESKPETKSESKADSSTKSDKK